MRTETVPCLLDMFVRRSLLISEPKRSTQMVLAVTYMTPWISDMKKLA